MSEGGIGSGGLAMLLEAVFGRKALLLLQKEPHPATGAFFLPRTRGGSPCTAPQVKGINRGINKGASKEKRCLE